MMQRSSLIFLGAITLIGLMRAWALMWIGDDAFISLKYSEMYALGEGLVFNRGEWVEGYTNFLWTWGLGVLAQLGAPLPQTALVCDLISFLGAIVVTALISSRLCLGLIPVFVMASAYPCVVFATSGLETMPATFCVLCGTYALVCRAPLRAGVAFVLGALLRPDHLLFWGCGGLSLLFTDLSLLSGRLLHRLKWVTYIRFSLPLLLIYIPYFAWRVHAYGAWFPNTYYAKSGDLTYWSQGGIYLASFLLGCGVWWLVLSSLISVVASAIRRTKRSADHVENMSSTSQPYTEHKEHIQAQRHLFLFCSLSLTIFGLYVVKVGGDFMLYRFFVVLLPLCWFIYPLLKPQRWWGRLTLSVAVALAITPVEIVKFQKKKWKLAAEETFYQVSSFYPFELSSRYARMGHDLRLLNDVVPQELRVAVDCVGMVGFYSKVRVFDLFGLTSPRVAHQPLKKRGRPGHEKYGSLKDALIERSALSTVNLWRRARYRNVEDYTRFRINSSRFYLLRYDPDLYDSLLKLREQGIKVSMPASPRLAAVKVQQEMSREPNQMLVSFLKRFYADVLPHEPELKVAIEGLGKNLNHSKSSTNSGHQQQDSLSSKITEKESKSALKTQVDPKPENSLRPPGRDDPTRGSSQDQLHRPEIKQSDKKQRSSID